MDSHKSEREEKENNTEEESIRIGHRSTGCLVVMEDERVVVF